MKSLLCLVCILAIMACSKNTGNDSKNKSENGSMFSGLSRSSTDNKNSLTKSDGSESSKPFAQVTPGYSISFPADHANHPNFAVEWWYITANLQDQQNKTYALQWTLFRFAGEAQTTLWANNQQYMGHVGLRDGTNHWFEERFARGGVGNAGISSLPFSAYIDDWQWLAQSAKMFPSVLEFNINKQLNVRLNLDTQRSFIKHGEQGFSRKLRDSEQASYYYSQPFIDVSGELELPTGKVQVTGNAWFDHEWTSQYLSPQALGWDWFSIHFDDGSKLMLFNMRHEKHDDFWSGTLITETGKSIHLTEHDMQAKVDKRANVEGRSLPLYWSIAIPEHKIDIQIAPMQIEQWNPGMFSYYEGGTVISGTHPGVGFIELTGY
jgi:predicted secreted hydrolase